MNYRLISAAIVLLLTSLISATSVHAAQDAIISVDKANIMDMPDDDATVIESKSSGDKIRVSNFSKSGWYKVRAKSGAYGWIWQSNVTLLNSNGEAKAAELDLKTNTKDHPAIRAPWFFLRALATTSVLFSTDISQKLGGGAYQPYYAPGGLGEMAFGLDEDKRLAIRIGYYSTLAESFTASGQNYSVTQSGFPILLGFFTDMIRVGHLEIGAGIYGGINYTASMTVSSGVTPPNTFTLQQLAPAAMLDFSFKYSFSRNFGLVLEVGGYYSQTNPIQVPTGINGTAPFVDVNGNLTSLRVRQMGPVLGLGVEIAL